MLLSINWNPNPELYTMKAMQKDPTLRYQSAAEMLRDIDNFKKNPSISFEYQYLSNDEEDKKKIAKSIDKVRELSLIHIY